MTDEIKIEQHNGLSIHAIALEQTARLSMLSAEYEELKAELVESRAETERLRAVVKSEKLEPMTGTDYPRQKRWEVCARELHLELHQIGASLMAAGDNVCAIVDSKSDEIRVLAGEPPIVEIERLREELREPCCPACGHDRRLAPTGELPLVKGALDAQEQAERRASAALERVRILEAALNRDRTGLAAALNDVSKIAKSYSWLAEGEWGNYEVDDRTEEALRTELGWCFDSMHKVIEDGLRTSGRIADRAFAVREKGDP